MNGCTLELRDGVSVVRMHRGRANAIDPEFLSEMGALAAELERGEGAVVLTGTGGFFSAGLDLPAVSALDRPAFHAFMRELSRVVARWFALPRPLVCAVNGHAIAGGCILAMTGDVRLAARGAYRIGVNEVELGVPFPASLSCMFAAQMGDGATYRATSSARLFDPEGARDAGFVDAVVEDLLPDALDRAGALGRLPAPAFAMNKRFLRGPVVERMAALDDAYLDAFVDTWFGPARPRIDAVVERLRAPRG